MVVILDVKNYTNNLKDSYITPNITNDYKRITKENNETFQNVITRFLKKKKKTSTIENTTGGLKAIISKAIHFYIQSEIHKERIAGRLIITSFVNSGTAKILDLVITINK